MVDTETPSRIPSRRLGLLRAVLLAPFLFFLASSMVVMGPVGTAAAKTTTTPPEKVTVSRALTSATSKTRVIPKAGVPGLIVNGVAFAGIFLYETRDLWVPWVNELVDGWFGKKDEIGCIQASFSGNGQPGFTVTAVSPPYCGTAGATYKVRWESAVDIYNNACTNGSSPNTARYDDRALTYTFTQSFSNICGGRGVARTVMYVEAVYSSTVWVSPRYIYDQGWEAANNTQKTDVQCENVLTGATQTISDTVVGHPDGYNIPSCEAQLGEAWHPRTVDVSVGGSAGTQVGVATIHNDSLDQYRDCFDPNTGAMQCKVRIFIDGQVCDQGRALCWDWQSTHKDQLAQVQCRFGPHVMPLTDCSALSRQYKPDSKVQTVTKADPVTGTPTIPNTDVVTSPPKDPNEPEPNPPTAPKTPTEVDPDSSNCFGQAVSFNPVNWVYVPIKCAFIWAFVPKSNIGTTAGNLRDKFSSKAPFAFVLPLATLPHLVGSNCPDWKIKIGTTVNENVVCNSSFTAAIRNARPFLAAGMIALAFWPLVRGMIYASMPLIKPVPTDGK